MSTEDEIDEVVEETIKLTDERNKRWKDTLAETFKITVGDLKKNNK